MKGLPDFSTGKKKKKKSIFHEFHIIVSQSNLKTDYQGIMVAENNKWIRI